MKSPLLRKSAKRHHAQQHPARPTRETRDIVRTQQLLPRGRLLVNPARESNVLGPSDRRRTLLGQRFFRHKRPSTCGSGRLGSSCHVLSDDASTALANGGASGASRDRVATVLSALVLVPARRLPRGPRRKIALRRNPRNTIRFHLSSRSQVAMAKQTDESRCAPISRGRF
jgi:hypothetical protein